MPEEDSRTWARGKALVQETGEEEFTDLVAGENFVFDVTHVTVFRFSEILINPVDGYRFIVIGRTHTSFRVEGYWYDVGEGGYDAGATSSVTVTWKRIGGSYRNPIGD